jgi:hypothetical protein
MSALGISLDPYQRRLDGFEVYFLTPGYFLPKGVSSICPVTDPDGASALGVIFFIFNSNNTARTLLR